MKKISSLFFGVMIIFTTNAFAERIPEGAWNATSSTAGDCPNCTINVKKSTPNIITITANNGWVGYAYYIQSKDMYKGAMEWKAGQGGAYENHIFFIELTYEGKTLTQRAHGTKLDFSTTYRKK